MNEATAALDALTQTLARQRPLPKPLQTPETTHDALAIVELIQAQGPLATLTPWRIHPRVAHALEQRTGHAPPGGWEGLVGLLAGAGVLRVEHDGVYAACSPQDLFLWGGGALRTRMLEALTRQLIPPQAAAGLMMMIGLHPAWGLRLAHEAHVEELQGPLRRVSALEDPVRFPRAGLDAAREGVFGALAATLEALRALPASRCFPIDSFAGVFEAACAMGRALMRERWDHRACEGAVPLLVEQLIMTGPKARARACEHLSADLLDHWLVPAGVAHRMQDHTFALVSDALPGSLRLHGLGRLDQLDWLDRLLRDARASMVA